MEAQSVNNTPMTGKKSKYEFIKDYSVKIDIGSELVDVFFKKGDITSGVIEGNGYRVNYFYTPSHSVSVPVTSSEVRVFNDTIVQQSAKQATILDYLKTYKTEAIALGSFLVTSIILRKL